MVQTLLSHLVVILVAGFGPSSFDAPGDSSDGVVWIEDMSWSEVKAMATWYQKPILVDFYASWCVPCRKLDENVYTDQAVVAELADLIAYKVDVEKPEHVALKEEFHVFSLPTVLLCRPDGEEIDRLVGYHPAEKFLVTIQDYQTGRNTLPHLKNRLREDPFNPRLLLEAGTKHVRLLNKHQARLLLNRARSQDPKNELGVAAWALWRLAHMERRLGNHDAAMALYQQILYEYPEYGMAERVLPMMAYVQEKMGDSLGMVSTYRELANRNPEDVTALADYAWIAAQVGVALEDATNIALKAVRLSDEDPDVMDTLAVVYHTRGMHREAITWIQRAIAKEPNEQYYHEQLVKFQSAAHGSWYWSSP
jgi:thioredoxin-like negative regulator of GroEL